MSSWESMPDPITYGRRGVDYFEDEEVEDQPTVVSFGYGRWFGNYVFEDRHEAEDFANLWDGEII